MGGLKIKLPAIGDVTDLPTVADDAMLRDGSLMIIDPTNSNDPWDAGVPAGGTTMPNVALAQAADLIGSGDASTLGAVWSYSSAITGTVGLIERTTKGGVHVIASQTNWSSNYVARLTLPSLIKQYLVDHPTHKFYASQWYRPTRQAINTGLAASFRAPKFELQHSSGPGTGYLIYLNSSDIYPVSGLIDGKEVSPSPDDLDDCFAAGSVTNWTGSVPADAAHVVAEVGWGALTAYTSSSWYNKHGSHVLYRFTLEDLTISGLSFSEVREQDKELWQYAVGSGRYSGDSWTDPSTIP